MSYKENKCYLHLEEGNLEEAKKQYNQVLKFGSHEEKFSLSRRITSIGFSGGSKRAI